MCGPSHIWPAAIGTRAFFRQSVWRELNAKPGQMRSEDVDTDPNSSGSEGGDRQESKKTRPSLPARTSFFLRFVSESIIAVADIHRAVGAPFPAAVVSEEMAMVVMTPPKKAVAKMPAADPVAVAAMPAVTMTACESLAGDGQRSGGQRQSRNRGANDCLELRHGLLLLGRASIALR